MHLWLLYLICHSFVNFRVNISTVVNKYNNTGTTVKGKVSNSYPKAGDLKLFI